MARRAGRKDGMSRYGDRGQGRIREKYDPLFAGSGTGLDEGLKGIGAIPVLGPLLAMGMNYAEKGKDLKAFLKNNPGMTEEDYTELGGTSFETMDLVKPLVTSALSAATMGLGSGLGSIGVGGNTATAGGGVLAPGVVADLSTGSILGNIGEAGSALAIGGNTATAGGGVLAPGAVADTASGELLGSLSSTSNVGNTFGEIVESLGGIGMDYASPDDNVVDQPQQYTQFPEPAPPDQKSIEVRSSADGIGNLFDNKMVNRHTPIYGSLGKPGTGYPRRTTRGLR
jgi:hypothetical protein